MEDSIKEEAEFQALIQQYQDLKHKVLNDPNEKIIVLPKELDNIGNIEYKEKISPKDKDRLYHLITQLRLRLGEGNGVAYYVIGVGDLGDPIGGSDSTHIQSLENLQRMAQNENAVLTIHKVCKAYHNVYLWVKATQKENIIDNIKITLLGVEGSGKSTLVGVLTKNIQDDGKGKARFGVFRYQHEWFKGRTTSISMQILGFDAKGQITNQDKFNHLSWDKIVERSAKLVTFIDVGGNDRYASTMIRGCSMYPDYALIVVDTINIDDNLKSSHFQLAFNFQVPIIIVITKIDMVKDEQITQFIHQIQDKLLSDNDCKGILIADLDMAIKSSQILYEDQTFVPIFTICNTQIESLTLLQAFLSQLQIRKNKMMGNEEEKEERKELYVSEVMKSDGQAIIGGMVHSGTFAQGDILFLGPNNDQFMPVQIESIHCNKHPTMKVNPGQICTMLLTSQNIHLAYEQLRKGMILTNSDNLKVSWTFTVELSTFDKSNRLLSHNQQLLIQTSTHIIQSAKVILDKQYIKGDVECCKSQFNEEDSQIMSKVLIRKDKFTKILMQFQHNPEYLTPGTKVIINKKDLKLFGKVTECFCDFENKYAAPEQKHKARSLCLEDYLTGIVEDDFAQDMPEFKRERSRSYNDVKCESEKPKQLEKLISYSKQQDESKPVNEFI